MKRESGRLILRDNRSFRRHVHELTEGDVLVGLLNIKPTEEVLFLDLVERGVILFPPALAQELSRSKCLQAMVYGPLMVPLTFVARDRHDLIRHIEPYAREGVERVITKQNRHNCGLGIHVWPSIEDVHNQACFGSLAYPFVVQPFVDTVLDVRVIVLGEYVEAYWRKNRHCFRNNLYFGGECDRYELSGEQWRICQEAMRRGKFPYAHLDLMVTRSGRTYLSEINLRGGLKGARISTDEYHRRIQAIEEGFVKGLSTNQLKQRGISSSPSM